MMQSKRIDQWLVELNIADSRAKAQRWIVQGQVEVYTDTWRTVTKSSMQFSVQRDCPMREQIRVHLHAMDRFVSRAGYKLQAALEYLDWRPSGLSILDIGQSTGGFTDCLLQAGCVLVIGIEVGHGQLSPKLVEHPRNITFEGLNARYISKDIASVLARPFDAVVMDVSFISQTLIWPNVLPLLKSDGYLLTLIKPQFELNSASLGKGGVVRSEEQRQQAQAKVINHLRKLSVKIVDCFSCQIAGSDGNQESFLWGRKP